MDYFDARDPDLSWDLDLSEERIQKSFEGKRIFITGCSGFLGKVLLEKILRSCPVDKIYLLLRTKRNVQPSERIKNLLKENIFEKARLKLGDQLMSKVEVIPGDCRLPKLGITDEDLDKICSNTNYVYHVAAALKMDETIRAAYVSNVQGTDEALKIACRMPNLKAFIYVSTAYSPTEMTIDEKFYDVNYRKDDLVKILSKVPDNILEVLSSKIMEKSPNTYAMTKGIAEDVVKSYTGRVPLAIVRPSIVVGCAQEPFVCWVGSVNGATGVLMAASIGVMRVWGGHHSLHVDIVPADYLINMTIAASWKVSQEKHSKDVSSKADSIYNFVCTPKAPTTWGEYMDYNIDANWRDRLFLRKTVFPFEFRLQPSWAMYRLQVILLHVFPGLLLDGLLKLFGQRPRLTKVYRKLHTLNSKLFFYCTNEWEFGQDNVDSLWSEMTTNERKIFPFDMTGFSWKDYFEFCPRGMKVYLLNESMKDKKKESKYIWMHQAYRVVKYSLLTKLFISTIYIIFDYFVNNIYFKNILFYN